MAVTIASEDFAVNTELGKVSMPSSAHVQSVSDFKPGKLLAEITENEVNSDSESSDPSDSASVDYDSSRSLSQASHYSTEERSTLWKSLFRGIGPAAGKFTGDLSRAADIPEAAEQKIQYSTKQVSRQDVVPAGSGSVYVRAAWSMVLGLYSGGEDIIFMVTNPYLATNSIAHSSLADAGDDNATLPVRYQVDRSQSIASLLLSIEALDEVLVLQRGANALSEAYRAVTELDTVSTRIVFGAVEGRASSTSKGKTYDLTLYIDIVDNRVSAQASYKGSIFSESRINQIIATFHHVLEQLGLADHNGTLGSLNACSQRDLEQILSWNEPLTQVQEHCIHALISQQAHEHPNSTAISAWDGTLTYGELAEQSDRLALYLSRLIPRDGAQHTVVPLCFEKSVYTVISMLAVLKIGAAYAALDPAHPTQRLEAMLQQVDARALLVSRRTSDRIPPSGRLKVTVDADLLQSLAALSRGDSDELASRAASTSPDDGAIVTFTSGSTGRPKAILLPHRAVCSCAHAFGPRMDFNRASRVLQNAAYAFDIHACEIFFTLIFGGCLVVTDKDKSRIAEVVRDNNVNWLFMTPSTTRLLNGPGDVPSVKTLMMIGEAPAEDIIRAWVRPDLHLINSYGPAENTLFSTLADLTRADDDPRDIGYGVNTLTWIVDPCDPQRLLPIGAVGELALEGQVAIGYLNDEEKTRRSFIEPPSWAQGRNQTPGRKMYLTGDLVHYTMRGTLRILGRKDNQVKLRGQRLELGEVEHHLREAIGQDFVVAVDCVDLQDHDQRLVAFACPRSAGQFERLAAAAATKGDGVLDMAAELRTTFEAAKARLSRELPSYMVPSAFVPMARMPTTVSTKLDRSRLRELARALPNLNSTYCLSATEAAEKVMPVTEAQSWLQESWTSILGIDARAIGINDDFFQLGGNSLSAIRLAAASNGRLSVADIFASPQLAALADFLDSQSGDALSCDSSFDDERGSESSEDSNICIEKACYDEQKSFGLLGIEPHELPGFLSELETAISELS